MKTKTQKALFVLAIFLLPWAIGFVTLYYNGTNIPQTQGKLKQLGVYALFYIGPWMLGFIMLLVGGCIYRFIIYRSWLYIFGTKEQWEEETAHDAD